MPQPLSTHQKLLFIAGLIVFAAILLLAFRAYLTPGMLLEFSSLQLCSLSGSDPVRAERGSE